MSDKKKHKKKALSQSQKDRKAAIAWSKKRAIFKKLENYNPITTDYVPTTQDLNIFEKEMRRIERILVKPSLARLKENPFKHSRDTRKSLKNETRGMNAASLISEMNQIVFPSKHADRKEGVAAKIYLQNRLNPFEYDRANALINRMTDYEAITFYRKHKNDLSQLPKSPESADGIIDQSEDDNGSLSVTDLMSMYEADKNSVMAYKIVDDLENFIL